MMRFFLTFVASWAISTWLLAELYYFVPEAQPVINQAQEIVRIPRHDQWDYRQFDRELENVVVRIDDTPFASIFPKSVLEQISLDKMTSQRAQNNNDKTCPFVWQDFTDRQSIDPLRDETPYTWIKLGL